MPLARTCLLEVPLVALGLGEGGKASQTPPARALFPERRSVADVLRRRPALALEGAPPGGLFSPE